MLSHAWKRPKLQAEPVASIAARELLKDEDLVAMVSIGVYPDDLRTEVLSELAGLIDQHEEEQARANPRDW